MEEDIDGLIHISDMSWSKRIKHPSEVLKKGDVVDAMVLNIDAENQRLSLGLKQLATDIWDDFFSRHHVGDTIEGKVVRMTNFGAFVELDEGIEGLIHVSEFDDSARQGEKIELTGGRDLSDEDHQARAVGAEDRALDPRAEVRRIPRRLGRVSGERRRRRGDARRSLQERGSRMESRTADMDTMSGSMTKAELVEEVSRVSDLTKKHSEVIVDTVFKSIIDALHRGEKIELRGFGSFRLRKREPRKGRNPKTGDKVDVPPKKVPYFKPGKELKELINKEADRRPAPRAAGAARHHGRVIGSSSDLVTW